MNGRSVSHFASYISSGKDAFHLLQVYRTSLLPMYFHANFFANFLKAVARQRVYSLFFPITLLHIDDAFVSIYAGEQGEASSCAINHKK